MRESFGIISAKVLQTSLQTIVRKYLVDIRMLGRSRHPALADTIFKPSTKKAY